MNERKEGKKRRRESCWHEKVGKGSETELAAEKEETVKGGPTCKTKNPQEMYENRGDGEDLMGNMLIPRRERPRMRKAGRDQH